MRAEAGQRATCCSAAQACRAVQARLVILLAVAAAWVAPLQRPQAQRGRAQLRPAQLDACGRHSCEPQSARHLRLQQSAWQSLHKACESLFTALSSLHAHALAKCAKVHASVPAQSALSFATRTATVSPIWWHHLVLSLHWMPALASAGTARAGAATSCKCGTVCERWCTAEHHAELLDQTPCDHMCSAQRTTLLLPAVHEFARPHACIPWQRWLEGGRARGKGGRPPRSNQCTNLCIQCCMSAANKQQCMHRPQQTRSAWLPGRIKKVWCTTNERKSGA